MAAPALARNVRRPMRAARSSTVPSALWLSLPRCIVSLLKRDASYSDTCRVYRDDPFRCETHEVKCVEGKDLRNPARTHCGGNPCIMHLNARYSVSHDEPAPLRI